MYLVKEVINKCIKEVRTSALRFSTLRYRHYKMFLSYVLLGSLVCVCLCALSILTNVSHQVGRYLSGGYILPFVS